MESPLFLSPSSVFSRCMAVWLRAHQVWREEAIRNIFHVVRSGLTNMHTYIHTRVHTHICPHAQWYTSSALSWDNKEPAWNAASRWEPTEMPARRNSLMAQKQNSGLAKIPLPSLSSEKIPVEAPRALAIWAELFILDHHPILHVKYKMEKCLKLGNGATVPDGVWTCINLVAGWTDGNLKGNLKKKITYFCQTTPRLKK